jgi:hypothetical protein
MFGATPALSQSNSFMFGASTAGAPAANAFGATPGPGANLFGGLGGIGGAGAATTSVFVAGAPAANAFGATPGPGANLFGGLGGIGGAGASAATTPAPSGTLFGSTSASAPTAVNSVLFGASTAGAPAANAFGSSLFGVQNSSSFVSSQPFLQSALGSSNAATMFQLPLRTPRSPVQTDFLKEFVLGIQQNKSSQVRKPQIDLMSEAIDLHQEHVNQCRAVLKFCGAKDEEFKETDNLKSDLDNVFDKYIISTLFG